MRYASIDILRTIAILVMVLVHFSENLSGYTPPIAGLGAPLFAFLSGTSYFLWVQGQHARGIDEATISKISVRRGFFVFGIGIVFNILVWLPEDIFNWDVLTLIGSALLLLNGVRRLPRPVVILIAVVAVLISPVLREMADYSAYWQEGHFDYDWTLTDVLIGYLATGYFPVFPWIAFSLSGFCAASFLFESRHDPTAQPPSVWPMVLVGSLMIAGGACGVLVRPWVAQTTAGVMLGGWDMFPPTTEYVLCALGATLALLGFMHQVVDRSHRAARSPGLMQVAKTFSRNSFSIYILHHLVHVWPMWIVGLAITGDPTHYWMKALPLSASLPLAIAFFAVCFWIFRRVGPERRYGIEGWMRWLCD